MRGIGSWWREPRTSEQRNPILAILDGSGVCTIGALVACSAGELFPFDGFGDKSLAVVRRSLASIGLTLRGE